METKTRLLLIILLLVIPSVNSFPQNSSSETNLCLLNAVFKLEDNIKKVDKHIQRYENEIAKCDKTINNSNNIISLAKQNGNKDAEKVALTALNKSTQAKQKNLDLLNSAKLKKRQSEKILTSLKDQLSQNNGDNPSVKGAALNYSGNVMIKKNSGQEFKLDENNSSLFENGDIITTAENSKLEMQFLEGRGNLILGEKSELKLNKDDSTDVIDMIKGKVKLSVQKIEEYEKALTDKYEELENSMLPTDKNLEKLFGKIRARINKLNKKFEVRTPSAVCAVRGTEFHIYEYDNSTELIITEGVVEMKSTTNLKTVLVKQGEKGVVSNDGTVSVVQQIDISKLEDWWDDEE